MLFGPITLALLLAALLHLGVWQTAEAALVGGGSLSLVYLTWAVLVGLPDDPALADVADALAAEVSAMWQEEAAERGLYAPYPLSVCWEAELSAAEGWDTLVQMASSGAGWPYPPKSDAWAAGPEGLAGEGPELPAVLRRVPTGRLVVLGEPGSGKTMLMVRLVLDLLEERGKGQPVPVLCSVASWNPVKQSLSEWLADMLPFDHPMLAAAAAPGQGTRVETLLRAGMILPILDGLDEIPARYRGQAIGRLNNELRPGAQLVVTCRTQEYAAAGSARRAVPEMLRGAAAIRLLPLAPPSVPGFLRNPVTGRDRWSCVIEALGTQSPLGQALTSPLMVALAGAVYNPRPGQVPGELPDPGKLCELSEQSLVERHLFDAFIPAVYRSGRRDRWDPGDAERWLAYLAHFLEFTMQGPDFAWWELWRSEPAGIPWTVRKISQRLMTGRFLVAWFGLVAAVVAGLLTGLAAGPARGYLAGLGTGLVIWLMDAALGMLPGAFVTWAAIAAAAGLGGVVAGGMLGGSVAGLAVGVTFGLAVGQARTRLPDAGARLSGVLAASAAAWLLAALAAGLADGGFAATLAAVAGAALVTGTAWVSSPRETAGSALTGGLTGGLTSGIVAGVMAGVAPGLVVGLAVGVIIAARGLQHYQEHSGLSLPGEYFSGAMSPARNLKLARQSALIQCCASMLASALAIGLVISVTAGVTAGVAAGISGGFVAGLACGRLDSNWLSYILARMWLAWHRHLPWRLMSFLADARDRGAIRQLGAIYQFRHIELQHRLAVLR